jgi:TPR repeat protein
MEMGIILVTTLIAFQPSAGISQTREEIRALYERREYARIRELAEAGNVHAELMMGQLQGSDRAEAKKWYRRAAAKDSIPAIQALASIYNYEKDDAEAARWYRRAAELGSPDDQVVLAMRLLQGRGVSKSERDAVFWYRKAVDQNYLRAFLPLAELYTAGIGAERDPVEAYALVLASLELSHDSFSDATMRKKAMALKTKLEAELPDHQIRLAKARARALRPDVIKQPN